MFAYEKDKQWQGISLQLHEHWFSIMNAQTKKERRNLVFSLRKIITV